MNQIMQHDLGGRGSSPVAGHYYAKSFGAPFKVYLANGVENMPDPATGKIVTSIIDLPGLIAVVVRSRVLHPRKLSAVDLRFIRSALCLKSKQLATAVELTPEHYSRCEVGLKTMSTATEKVYRCYVYLITFARDKNLHALKKEKTASAEDGQKALRAFRKLFLELKISPVFDPNEELEFVFARRCPDEDKPCGDDDAEWNDEVDQIAA